MTTTKRGHCFSRSAFGKVRFSGHINLYIQSDFLQQVVCCEKKVKGTPSNVLEMSQGRNKF